MKLKKLASAMAISMALVSGTTFADAFYMDVGAAGNPGFFLPDGNTVTSVFNSFQLFANTTSKIYDTNGSFSLNTGDKFIDAGNANFTSGLPNGDQEGINLFGTSEITLSWSNLVGSVISTAANGLGGITTTTSYVAGGVFDFYFDAPGNANYGASVGSADDTGFSPSNEALPGTKVLTLTLTGGTGSSTFGPTGNFVTGSSNLFADITFALDNFWWFDSNGNGVADAGDKDFHDLLGLLVPVNLSSAVDQNTNHVVNVPGSFLPGPAGFGNELLVVHSDHDGSIEFSVPEPTTIALLGMGLLGMGIGSRNKKAS